MSTFRPGDWGSLCSTTTWASSARSIVEAGNVRNRLRCLRFRAPTITRSTSFPLLDAVNSSRQGRSHLPTVTTYGTSSTEATGIKRPVTTAMSCGIAKVRSCGTENSLDLTDIEIESYDARLGIKRKETS
jgi:hypothetical protein